MQSVPAASGRIRLLFVGAAALAALLPGRAAVLAQGTASTQVPVSANVRRNCTISATAVAFGAYDPVVANATQPLDSTGSLTVTCTRGTPANIGLDRGQSAQGQTRRMTGAASDFLTYGLFTDSNRAQDWGDSGAAVFDAGVAPSLAPRTFQIYGRVPPGQDVTAAAFNDVVLATISF
jgi:spore coat protein U-like protein